MSNVPRNPAALPAKMRTSAGPMRHRLAPRGGARNDMQDLLLEYELHTEDESELAERLQGLD